MVKNMTTFGFLIALVLVTGTGALAQPGVPHHVVCHDRYLGMGWEEGTGFIPGEGCTNPQGYCSCRVDIKGKCRLHVPYVTYRDGSQSVLTSGIWTYVDQNDAAECASQDVCTSLIERTNANPHLSRELFRSVGSPAHYCRKFAYVNSAGHWDLTLFPGYP